MSSAQTETRNDFFSFFESSDEESTENESQNNAVFLFFNNFDQTRENSTKRKEEIPVSEEKPSKRQRVLDAIPIDAICLEDEGDTKGSLLWYGNNSPVSDYNPTGPSISLDTSDKIFPKTDKNSDDQKPIKKPVMKKDTTIKKQSPENNKPIPKKTTTLPKSKTLPSKIPTQNSRLAQQVQIKKNEDEVIPDIPPVPSHAFYCDGIFNKWSQNTLKKTLETFIYYTEEVIQRQRRCQLADFIESIEPSISTNKYNKVELQFLIKVLKADIQKHLIMKEM